MSHCWRRLSTAMAVVLVLGCAATACSRDEERRGEAPKTAPAAPVGDQSEAGRRRIAEASVAAALARGNRSVSLEGVLLVQSFPGQQRFIRPGAEREVEEVNPFSADSLRVFFASRSLIQERAGQP